MTRLYNFIAVLILLTACSYSPPNSQQHAITGDTKTDVNNLLPDGKVTVDIMDGIKSNKRQDELTKKLQLAVQSNYEWFVDYTATIPAGQIMPYHVNLGLTKKEYQELVKYMGDIESVSTGKEEITVIKQDNIIQFKASGRLELLGFVKINLTRNTVMVGEYELPFSHAINNTDDKVGLKSKWQGYSWKFEEPKNINDMDPSLFKDLQTLKFKLYEINIGLLEKNGKTLLRVKGQEIENGVQQVSFDLPLVF